MKTELQEMMEQCFWEYQRLFGQNEKQYIAHSQYKEFLVKYKPLLKHLEDFQGKVTQFEYEKLQEIAKINLKIAEHNQVYLDWALQYYQNYFDEMFLSFGEKIILDEEQRKIILADDDAMLVVAGAGSGKTTTMAAKVKYLVDIKKVDPKKIAIVSYTNKAAEELEEMICGLFQIPAEVTTFHSLAFKFVRKMTPKKLRVASPSMTEKVILDYIREQLFPNKQKMKQFVDLYPSYFNYGFKENFTKFPTFLEYFEDYKQRKYQKEKDILDFYIENRITQLLQQTFPKSICNEVYKSVAEAKIANYLYRQGIDYHYEQFYPEKVAQDKTYLPDFTLDIHGKPVYVEYFGLSSCYDHGWNQKKVAKYNTERKRKEKFHREHGTDLIALDYKTLDATSDHPLLYLEKLESELLLRGATFYPRSDKEVFMKLLEGNIDAEFFMFQNLLVDIISTVKDSIYRERVFSNLCEKTKLSDLSVVEKRDRLCEIGLLEEVYDYYQEALRRNGMVDYSDMIYFAYHDMDLIHDPEGDLNYQYFIIDEYQDISLTRFYFAKKMATYTNAKIVAVGDDWQAIFAFAGSNVRLFYDFDVLFPGARELAIHTTYRNSQELVDISSEFILKNSAQLYKNLIAQKHLEHPIEVVYYLSGREFDNVVSLIEKIHMENPQDHILLLSRRNKTIKQLTHDSRFQKGVDSRIVYRKYPEAIIDILTIHSAKGLTADWVIVLNLNDQSFPSHGYANHWIIDDMHRQTEDTSFPFAEERRLFYVALTRTKNKVYLSAPYQKRECSRFVHELKADVDLIENFDYIETELEVI